MIGPARDVDGRGRERKVYQMHLVNKEGNEINLNIKTEDLGWFETSPDAGDPDCICSYCSFVIPETDIPIRLYHNCKHPDCELKNKEARLHPACFGLLVIKDGSVIY